MPYDVAAAIPHSDAKVRHMTEPGMARCTTRRAPVRWAAQTAEVPGAAQRRTGAATTDSSVMDSRDLVSRSRARGLMAVLGESPTDGSSWRPWCCGVASRSVNIRPASLRSISMRVGVEHRRHRRQPRRRLLSAPSWAATGCGPRWVRPSRVAGGLGVSLLSRPVRPDCGSRLVCSARFWTRGAERRHDGMAGDRRHARRGICSRGVGLFARRRPGGVHNAVRARPATTPERAAGKGHDTGRRTGRRSAGTVACVLTQRADRIRHPREACWRHRRWWFPDGVMSTGG